MASRYTCYDSRSSSSSYFSDPYSSIESLNTNANSSNKTSSASRALVKKPKGSSSTFTSMVKKFMEKKSSSSYSSKKLVVPGEVMAARTRAATAVVTTTDTNGFIGLQKKLFTKGGENKMMMKKKDVKALTELKSNNTRTLATVLRSERELLNSNKELEIEISQLKTMIDEKNKEVEKLKDLCLKQREEIKSLKTAVLFPDSSNSHLQELLEKQGLELKQAKQLIPNLQMQVTTLTGQLQCLAEDLAEVKADKYARVCKQQFRSSPMTPEFDYEEAANSLEFSSCDRTTPGSPDDMYLEDLNPCLTPYCAKTKSKEFDSMGYKSQLEESLSYEKIGMQGSNENSSFSSHHSRNLSKSSECYQSAKYGTTAVRGKASRKSEETMGSNYKYGMPMHHKLF